MGAEDHHRGGHLTLGRKRGRPHGQSDILEPEEIRKMLALPDRRTKEGLRDYALLVLMANTPLRKAEICSLKRGNLVERGGDCWIEYGVRKKREDNARHRIFINAKVYEALMAYQRSEFKRRCGDPVNPLLMTLGKHGPYGKEPITPRAVDCVVVKYAELAGIGKRITPHSFRATFATRAMQEGMDIKTVSMMLGHASTASTEPYLRTNIERMKRAAEVFCYV